MIIFYSSAYTLINSSPFAQSWIFYATNRFRSLLNVFELEPTLRAEILNATLSHSRSRWRLGLAASTIWGWRLTGQPGTRSSRVRNISATTTTTTGTGRCSTRATNAWRRSCLRWWCAVREFSTSVNGKPFKPPCFVIVSNALPFTAAFTTRRTIASRIKSSRRFNKSSVWQQKPVNCTREISCWLWRVSSKSRKSERATVAGATGGTFYCAWTWRLSRDKSTQSDGSRHNRFSLI